MRAERWHSYHLTSYTHLQKQTQTSHSHRYSNKEDFNMVLLGLLIVLCGLGIKCAEYLNENM